MSSPVWNTRDMKIEYGGKTYLTREDTALLLDVTMRTVSRYLEMKYLQKFTLGNRVYLSEEQVLRFKKERETLHATT